MQSIKKRIDYVRSFPELYLYATEFHRELSTIPYIDEIFTTNWDDFFERECSAVPIVTSPDFAVFGDLPGRKVFKLHGSVNNYGSIVATTDDYRKCYRKLSREIIGNLLRTHLMTRTFVFVGYSFEDEDFQKICTLLSKEVQGLIPHSYVVTLDETANLRLKSVPLNMSPIITSATYFMQVLKGILVKNKHMVPDDRYKGLGRTYAKVMVEHAKLSALSYRRHPDSLFSQSYQDGLQHAFGHVRSTMKSGENSDLHRMIHVIDSYEILKKRCIRQGNYPDAAYFQGYGTGLIYFLADEKNRRGLPMYHLFGAEDIRSFSRYLELERRASKLHKAAHELAEKIAESVHSEGLVLHRSPFLGSSFPNN